jgi:CRP/FNR family transcriptional regulator
MTVVPTPTGLLPQTTSTPARCDQCPIRHKAICGTLPPEQLNIVERMRTIRLLDRHEPIAWQGEAGRYLAVVRSGIVRLSASTARGTQLIVGLAFPGALVGRAVGEGSGFDIQPIDGAEICLLPRHKFEALSRDHPPLGHVLLQGAFDDLDDLRKWMQILGTVSAGKRLATFVLHLCDTIGVPTPVAGQIYIDMPFTRQQIADLLGLNIETVSREITKLRTLDFLTSPNRFDLLIRNREALQDHAASRH